MQSVSYEPIGILRSPYTTTEGMPVQPIGAMGVLGHLEIRPDLAEGLLDLQHFSHVILIYHLHRIARVDLVARPFLDQGTPHGIFATRHPTRPNPIGMSVLRLVSVEGPIIHLENVDILDGTPVLDIKPYVSFFDVWSGRNGWFDGKLDKAQQYRVDAAYRGMSNCREEEPGA